jgi:hypothetical protein
MHRLARFRLVLPLLGVLLLLVPTVGHVSAQAAPTIKLIAPTSGQAISGPLDVRVQISGLKLDGTKIGTPAQAGVGHWHVYVDGKYAGLSVSDVVTIPNDALPEIAAGQHEIKVQLHNNDHTPIQPDVIATATVNFTQDVKFTPATGSAAIKILAPAGGAQLSTSQPNLIKVQITGLKLDGTKIGTPPQQGVGHWHLYVDGKYAGLSVSDSISLPNDAMPEIAPGQHELKVQLHNNDHTPIQPDVVNAITVNFTAGQPAGGGQQAATTSGAAAGQNQPAAATASSLPRAGSGDLASVHRGWWSAPLALVVLAVVGLLLFGGWFWQRSRTGTTLR